MPRALSMGTAGPEASFLNTHVDAPLAIQFIPSTLVKEKSLYGPPLPDLFRSSSHRPRPLPPSSRKTKRALGSETGSASSLPIRQRSPHSRSLLRRSLCLRNRFLIHLVFDLCLMLGCWLHWGRSLVLGLSKKRDFDFLDASSPSPDLLSHDLLRRYCGFCVSSCVLFDFMGKISPFRACFLGAPILSLFKIHSFP